VESSEYRQLKELHKDHFWFRTTFDFIASLVLTHRPSSLLDAGCGYGELLARFDSRVACLHGIDIEPDCVANSVSTKALVSCASITALPFDDSSFEFVTSVDVLYHKYVDEPIALAEIKRVLVPGGRCFLQLPALPWMWSDHDVRVMGRERYTKKELNQRLKKAGLEVERVFYRNGLILPFALFGQIFWKAKRGVSALPLWINTTMGLLCRIEHAFIRAGMSSPLGTSVCAIARKK